MSFKDVELFEKKIAHFFGAPYAVATDSCTHALELCLRYRDALTIHVPKRTYISVPMLAKKLDIKLFWRDEDWVNYYEIYPDIIDAAVLWKKNSYIPNTLMCLSFQHQKHLSLGRGGVILCDDEKSSQQLKKMSYDGRLPNIPWREQNIDTMGYHYYMTPETAKLGLARFVNAINKEPRQWTINDWPDLTQMEIFK
jgi:dTDP-4-amino-4,6-dideoxygalactose transaminase